MTGLAPNYFFNEKLYCNPIKKVLGAAAVYDGCEVLRLARDTLKAYNLSVKFIMFPKNSRDL